MKKRIRVKELFLSTMLLAALVVAPAVARAADPYGLPGAFSITLNDGNGNIYCDFFNVTLQSSVLVTGIQNLSENCGGADGLALGNIGFDYQVPPFSATSKGINVSSSANIANGGDQAMYYLFNLKTRTWVNYFWDGTTLTPGYSGGFTLGKPINHSGLSSIVLRH